MRGNRAGPGWLIVPLALFLAGPLLVSCGLVMHPKAGDYLRQARGADGIETLLTLTSMMEESLRGTRGAAYEASLDKLHDQFHALHRALCQVSETHAAHPAYVKAVTLEEEMRAVFHRLWEYRRDDTFRDLHLDLFAARLRELRSSLQSVRSTARNRARVGLV